MYHRAMAERASGDAAKNLEALVFDIQRFSLHDGPGLRTTVFFKGCSLRCLWCQNPESRSALPEIAFYAELCARCFLCAGACPSGAIDRGPARRVDASRCDACGRCAQACPSGALRLVGRSWSAPALAEELLLDRDFFDESGGGVTLSGGEPMLRPAFVQELCGILKGRGVRVALETAGHYDPGPIGRLRGLVDLVYFDLKHADGVEHERLAGAGNGLVLRSLARFAAEGFEVQPRMPVVPGANDGEPNLRATAGLIRALGLGSVHVLPYHELGAGKLARLGERPGSFSAVPPSAEDMERVRRIFEEEGIDAVVYA
jgi:pyruvate formate lyase activating enzyme